MALTISLTIGQPVATGGWQGLSDRGERHAIPASAAEGWHPVPGQRVVAELVDGRVSRVRIPQLSRPPSLEESRA